MDNPLNLFVAGFFGVPPMNLLSGGFISESDLVLDDTLIPLPARLLPLVQNDQPVTLGMRPEAVRVSAETHTTNGIQLPGEVETFESDFVHRIHAVQIRTGRWIYSGHCPIDVNLQIGQSVQATIDPDYLYFFDNNSGLRI
jgi:multiple sugar transport system ATP-binding protein